MSLGWSTGSLDKTLGREQNLGQGEEVSIDTWQFRQQLQNTTTQLQDSSHCTEVTPTCWTENRDACIYEGPILLQQKDKPNNNKLQYH